jgi:P27 family predicted phage terminase small subunit
MARKCTPNQVLKARGSRRVRENEPEARSGKVVATRELGPEATRAFGRICAELDALGYLSPTYAEMITIAADSIGDIEIASDDLKKRGHLSITERGETKNPSWTIKTSAQMCAHRYLTALGLSPTSIGKLTGTKKPEANDFEGF